MAKNGTKDIAVNTFEAGMSLDLDELLQKANTMALALNIRFVARDNTIYVISNIKGNIDESAISGGYVPVGIASKNGVAYILSAEISGGIATGSGQIGTFPSPDYSTGNIIQSYRALQNYSGDTPGPYGDFISSKFNFTLRYDLDVELQNSYDGTVNVVITDGENPMRIFNSGFAVLPNRTYSLVEQTGGNDTNQYDLEDWETVINLVQVSNKIMNVTFEGLDVGGNNKGGNYSYFFKYATQDGNETDVVETSRTVSIFHGNSVDEIKGGEGDGEIVPKTPRFTLSNLDESYAYVVPYFIWVSGKEAPLVQAVRIDTKIPITGTSIEFSHNGFEEVTIVEESLVSDNNGSIETARTIGQFQGRLWAANIKTKNAHDQAFLDFSKNILIGSVEEDLDTPDFRDIALMASSTNDQATVVKDGWNNAYYNPKNIYNKLGHMGGETYPYRIVFILPDGSNSSAYPMTGIDNIGNLDLDTLYAQIGGTEISDMEANNGYYTGLGTFEDTMLNTNGIYRFPNRDEAQNMMFDKGNNSVSINGVTFEIPTIPQEIKDKSIGCFFVRGEKIEDALTQGVFFNTVSVPNFDFFRETDFYGLRQYNGGVYTEQNSMSIPAYNYMMEAQQRYIVDNDFGGDWLGEKDVLLDGIGSDPGIFYSRFIQHPASDSYVTLYNQKKFAFLSNHIWSEKESFISKINGRSITFNSIYRVQNIYDVQSVGVNAGNGGSGEEYQQNSTYFSVIRPDNLFVNALTKDADMSWVTGGSKNENQDSFAGGALFATNPAARLGDGLNYRNIVLYQDIKYNDYVGLYLKDDTINVGSGYPNWDNQTDVVNESGFFGTTNDSMIYANVYQDGGQRTQSAVKNVYGNGDNLIYTPITKRMYWDNTIKDADTNNLLVDQLDGNGKIIVYGGDTYVGSSFRKMFFNAKDIEEFNVDGEEAARCNNGYSIQFMQESNYNPALRNESIVDTNEISSRTFNPYEITGFTYDQGENPVTGDENPWRNDARILETAGYNKGYGDSITRKNNVGINQLAPFVRENWLSRVWFSGQHIPNSFQNSYRNWNGTAYQDYDSSLGEIVALKAFNNGLYAIQENGIGLLSINERVETGADNAGSIFIEASNVLSPYIGQMSSTMGSKYKASIIATENGLYGYSEEFAVIWKIGRDGLNNTSDFNVGSYLTKYGPNWRGGTDNTLGKNIRGFYDAKNHEVVYAFIDGAKSFTLGYNEVLGVFTSFYSYIPQFMFSVYDEMYSFKNGKIWRHDDEDSDRVKFYGGDFNFEIHLIVNQGPIGTKVYENLQLVSNNEMPTEIRYKVQGAEANQTVVYDPENIHLSNAFYRDEKVMVSIPVVDTVTDASASGYYSSAKDNALSLLQSTAKMRGKTMRVELIYDSKKQLRLHSVVSFYRRSFS